MFLTIGLLALQVVAVLGAPIEAEDEPFDFEFSQLGEEMYLVVETRNHTEKLLEEWSDDDGSINPEEMGPFVQGDLYQPVLAKNAVKFKSRKWAKAVVPYKISDSFGYSDVQRIQMAFKMFHQKTCVRFVPRASQRDFIAIEKSSSGCWSTVGRAGGRQVVNLQSSCLRQIGTVLHELMHALGFLHEHTRHDRDKFVDINYLNVRFDAIGNFWKETKDRTSTLGTGYDLGSVLHYSRKAFSWNGFNTIDPKVKFSGKIGQRNGFSNSDIKRIKAMYCNG
ncbi:zinc metalloproteinase nas-7 [Aedes aegypti]|uniref:Metalloendopeptidase n=1 Tax=Aedes aegypti TaxID=7159 RepID=A0A903UZJ6_AEDAE|nr:zinc metalloproteinase nas-7 [Aedes aegypti]